MEVISIPKKIIALLSKEPGMLVLYETIWEHCWGGQFTPTFCMNTLQANISYARKRLKRLRLGYIRNVRDHGYIFFYSTFERYFDG